MIVTHGGRTYMVHEAAGGRLVMTECTPEQAWRLQQHWRRLDAERGVRRAG